MIRGLLALKLIFNFCRIVLSDNMSEPSIFNSNNKQELPDDWWVASHKKRIARKRGEWRDATKWKSNLSSPEDRMQHITNIPVHISHKNSTKICRWYRRMNKCYFMFDWVWSHLGVLDCSGAGRMINDDYNKKMNSEYKKFINS